MMSRRTALRGAGALVAGGGCLSADRGARTTNGSTKPRFGDGRVRFYLSPSVERSTKLAAYAGIRKYLDAALDPPVELVYADTYAAVLDALGSGRAELGEVGSIAAALGVRNGTATIALQRRGYGSWTYGSVLVTREDTGIESVADVEGTAVAFGDRLSTSGALMPLYMLAQRDVDIGALPAGDGSEAAFEPTFTSHTEAWERLKTGEVSVAGVGKFVTENDAGELRSGYRYLDQYRTIPNPPFVTSRALHDAETRRVVELLADAPERIYYGRDGTAGTDDDPWFDALRPATVSRYQPVVDAAKRIGVRQELLETSE